ncbi:MAG: 50S ribosomal protein L21 [Pyramidobacter sp.]|nr:50S ribosomal protein L21 [Pyramidobacter sp.]
MYAIIETGGKQYRVTPGEKVLVEKLGLEEGASVVFDKVLMVGSEESVKVGTPLVAGATVTGTVSENGKAKKVIVFKYKNKTNQRRFRGHRQPFTVVTIDSINA